MVNAVTDSFDPMAFLNNVKGITPATTATTGSTQATDTQTPTATTASPDTDSTNNNGKGAALPTDIVSLLTDASNSADTLANLLSNNSSDPLSGVYSALYKNAAASAYNTALANTPKTTDSTKGGVTDVLASLNSARNAYNATAIQNAQDVLNSTGSGTSITA